MHSHHFRTPSGFLYLTLRDVDSIHQTRCLHLNSGWICGQCDETVGLGKIMQLRSKEVIFVRVERLGWGGDRRAVCLNNAAISRDITG
jgi:hypothetical protein